MSKNLINLVVFTFFTWPCFTFGADIEDYRKLAEQGDAKAQYSLGVCYQDGAGVAQDSAKAAEWFRKSAEQGYAGSQYNLGLAYATGDGTVLSYVDAAMWYRKAAEQGNANAQYMLGGCYCRGEGVAKDFTEAVKWYNKATELGHDYAKKALIVAKNAQEALAAEQGNANAQYNLGRRYFSGDGVVKDEAEAVKWCIKAAKQGNSEAQDSLGWCYENGVGIAKDPVEAVKWYQKAAEQGDAAAQNHLGLCYYNGARVNKDPLKAAEFFRKSAEQGNADAQSNLGACYYNGTGVDKDVKKAVELYRKAAEQGNTTAQFNLGLCYRSGEGVAQDSAKAFEWYRKSAEKGDAKAQYVLGLCYANGEGIAQDSVKASEWYRKAALQGDKDAKAAIEPKTSWVAVIIWISLLIGVVKFFLSKILGRPYVAISRVLKKNNSLILKMKEAISNKTSPTIAFQTMINQMKIMDLSKCPNEFKDAYLNYYRAWQRLAEQIASEPQGIWGKILLGFASGQPSNSTDGRGGDMDSWKHWSNEIDGAYKEVLAVSIMWYNNSLEQSQDQEVLEELK